MDITTTTPTQLETMIAESKATEAAAKAALHRNGQPVYAPDEQQRLTLAAEQARRDTLAAVKGEIDRRLEAIEPMFVPVEIDPLASLSSTELAKATALAAFIREDAERATTPAAIDAFVRKMRLAVAGNDPAAKAMYLRYASDRENFPKLANRLDVAAMVTTLTAAFAPPVNPALPALREKAQTLRSVWSKALTEEYLLQAYGRRG